ncbi:hypothetical protein [Limobrevibacterium gyesilva]|uniref:Uncharacterized protein n=1 Tax=Limobrevibacterium gyesilva TaxID=2991712 RepID=A0AA41YUM9_9PROT|nr:hypothetical protein [Limobrevibacterium gyesilva]MCW3476888.1 hypothetical protein [Limobrevibacterium gyesilva]
MLAACVAAFLSYKAVSNQITETTVLGEDRVSLARYLDGTAARPFAYRYLTPVLVNFARDQVHVPALLPDVLKAKTAVLCARATSEPAPSCDSVVAYAAVAGAYFFLFLMTVYVLSERLFGNPLIALASLGFSFLAVNAILLLGLSHIYDFGVLLFGTLLLLCLEYRWNLVFLLLLVPAYLMKETLILYAGTFFFVNIGRMPLARNLLYFLAQLALFVIVHGAVRAHFAGNAGAGHEYYLPEQIYFFTEHINLPMLMLMVGGLLAVFYDFPNKQETLRRASIIMIPWFLLFVTGGVQRELRVIFEILPLVLLLAMETFVRIVLGSRPGSHAQRQVQAE